MKRDATALRRACPEQFCPAPGLLPTAREAPPCWHRTRLREGDFTGLEETRNPIRIRESRSMAIIALPTNLSLFNSPSFARDKLNLELSPQTPCFRCLHAGSLFSP